MTVEEFKRNTLCDDIRLAPKNWKGFKVYMAVYKETVEVGLPSLLLEKDGAFKEIYGEKSFEIIDAVF